MAFNPVLPFSGIPAHMEQRLLSLSPLFSPDIMSSDVTDKKQHHHQQSHYHHHQQQSNVMSIHRNKSAYFRGHNSFRKDSGEITALGRKLWREGYKKYQLQNVWETQHPWFCVETETLQSPWTGSGRGPWTLTRGRGTRGSPIFWHSKSIQGDSDRAQSHT